VDPHLLDYGPRTALLVDDVQNGCADPSGSLYLPGAGGVVDTSDGEICRAGGVGAHIR